MNFFHDADRGAVIRPDAANVVGTRMPRWPRGWAGVRAHVVLEDLQKIHSTKSHSRVGSDGRRRTTRRSVNGEVFFCK